MSPTPLPPIKDQLPPVPNSIGSFPQAAPPPPAASSPPVRSVPPPYSNNTKKILAPLLVFLLLLAGGSAFAYFRLIPQTATTPSPPAMYPTSIETLEFITKFEYQNSWQEGGKEITQIYDYNNLPSNTDNHKILRFHSFADNYPLCPYPSLTQTLQSLGYTTDWINQFGPTIFSEISFGWAQYGPGIFHPSDCFDIPNQQECGPFTARLGRSGDSESSPYHDFNLLKSSCPYEIDITQLFEQFGYDSNNQSSGTIMVKTFIEDPSDTRKSDNLTVHLVNYAPSQTTPTPTTRPTLTPTPTIKPTSTPTPNPSFTPTPTIILQCLSISKTPSSVTKGSTITFTCSGTTSNLITSFKFRISRDNGNTWTNLISDTTPTLTDSNTKTYQGQSTYTIPDFDTYLAQCQVCSAATCTAWNQAEITSQ